MKIFLIGANGQLGTDIMKVFKSEEILPLTHEQIEIVDLPRSKQIIEDYNPEVIINTAAYHNVPDCEKNLRTSFSVNAIGVRNLAQICRTNSIRLVHISTDYVFDGKKSSPYDEEDTPNPLNVYGVSKLAGEYFAKRVEKHYIIRVASLFGITGCRAKGGRNFVETMFNAAKTRDTVQVTSNIICSPTYTYDAALKIKEILENDYRPGIYHVINDGNCSWYEFALEIFRQAGINIKVEEREESEEVNGITRPLYSPLTSNEITSLRHWKEALSAYLLERGNKEAETKPSK